MADILLVEDDRTIALGLEYTLRAEGYGVRVCATKEEALTALASGAAFDLALLDLTLPDGSGYDVCAVIRRQGDMPVVFLTAVDDEANVVMGLDMGGDDYITKPFRVRELLSRIRTVMRRRSQSSGEVLHLHGLAVNTAQARVSRGGEEIPLTALEYRLLLTFLQNEGQLLTRRQLLEGVWDVSGDFVTDNTLTVYIKRLREKIEEDPQNPRIIQTVRGLGYRAGE